jgi:DNA-binding transcriptional MerR regulator
VTTAQAAALCRVEPATVRSWVFRGYLVPHGRRGRFRLGDVDVAERMVRERESYTPEQRILAAILSETP